MPIIFPSHKDLAIPLAHKWPNYFDIPALYVGAAMPDVVDGIFGLYRGHLGQWYGHTLVGKVVFCLQGGLLLIRLLLTFRKNLSRYFKHIHHLRPAIVKKVHSAALKAESAQSGIMQNRLAFLSLSA